MSGEPRAPPPPSSRMQALQDECARLQGYKDLCAEYQKENNRLMKEYRKVIAKLKLAHDALTAANIPIPPEPEEDPQEAGTRKRHRRYRRKRTSRVTHTS